MKYISLLTLTFLFTASSFGQVQIGKDINGERHYDHFGTSVSISDDGSIMAVGSPDGEIVWKYDPRLPHNAGHVRVYRREPPAPSNGYVGWVQIGRNIDGDENNDEFGHSVSLSGDGSTVAIGAPENNWNAGRVRVYRREPPAPSNGYVGWVQIGRNIDGDANDRSGSSVSLSSDGSTVAIGASSNDGNGSYAGHVRVYKNISGTWTQQGSDIDGEAAGDISGRSVSLSSDGSTVAIGAVGNDGNGKESGHVRIYKNINGTWTQVGQDIDGEAAGDQSGTSVSLSSDGSTVAIGSPYDGYSDSGKSYNMGYVRIYENISGNWTQVGSDIAGEEGGWSGYSVSLSADGSVVAIGAPKNIGNYVTNNAVGSARIYKNTSGTWTQVGKDIDGTELGGNFGWSVSLSGDGSTVIIGDFTGKGDDRGYAEVYSTGISMVGVTEIKSEFTIYPNPASDELNIKIESNLIGSQFRIINTLGQEVRQGELSKLISTIDVSKLPKGSYNMLIGTENYSHSFLVE